MPFCYGGGIKTAAQASKIISLGVEKIAVSSSAIENPNLITQISKEIGKQSVVVVLDVKKRMFNRGYDVYTHNGKNNTKISVEDAFQKFEELGTGEIVINSIDNDGKMSGYDLSLASKIKEFSKVPLTILGGAGSLKDIEDLLNCCGLIGSAAGSLFVFKGKYKAVLINCPSHDEIKNLF